MQTKTEEKWTKLIARYGRSGLTQKAFCAAHNVPISSFTSQLGRMRAASAKVPEFVELSAAEPSGQTELEILFPSGTAVRIRG